MHRNFASFPRRANRRRSFPPGRRASRRDAQRYLDDFLRRHPEAAIDYIHGDEVLRRLSRADGAMGFLLPALNKADFFPAIEQLGILPRKTFSMGHAHDKRFYIECRKIL